jgi:hypothetical protein
MPGQETTSYDDASRQFAGRSANARELVRDWMADPYHACVVPFVEAHVTAALYRLTPRDVAAVCEETEHALGDVSRQTAESVASIRDWHPPFAFVHMLHYALEAEGAVPTYQRFRQMSVDDDFLAGALLRPSRAAVSDAQLLGSSRQAALDAMRWRVGNAYYSFLREVYTIVALRSIGLDVRYHVLADALFAVDFWCGDTAVSLYVGNARFKQDSGGRKVRPETVFADARPPLAFREMTLPVAPAFGVVHLPAIEQIRQAATMLEGAT